MLIREKNNGGPMARGQEEYSGAVTAKMNKGVVSVGKAIPNFKVSSTAKEPFNLKAYKGKSIVLYFYPKDATSGCTQEGHDFTALHKKFKRQGAEVFGISKDSLKSHFKFLEKQGYTFDLLSDEEQVVCKGFDVVKEKSMYGRKYMGIERSTFLIDEGGKLLQEWRKVKVKGHAEEVLEFLREYNKG